MRKLKYSELKRFLEPAELGFADTSSITAGHNLIGQSRAVAAFDFGLSTRLPGYNIYVCGIAGSGKTTFACKFAENIAKNEAAPNDMCYVYNFKEPKQPKLLSMSPGTANELKEDMEDMVAALTADLMRVFSDADFESRRHEIHKKHEKKRDQEIKHITTEAKKSDFDVKFSKGGIYFIPIVDGEAVSEEDFDKLPEDVKDKITENSDAIHGRALNVMRTLRDFEGEYRKQVEEMEYGISLFAVGRQINKLQVKYENQQNVLDYLALLKEDLLENIDAFLTPAEGEEEDGLQNIMPWLVKKTKEDVAGRYKVNVIADNSKRQGAPVICCTNPTYANIMGEVEYDSEFGNLTTDYMKIKPGLLHMANGGYLILQAKDVLGVPYVWEGIKRAVKTGEITIENPKEYTTGLNVSGIRPEAAAFDIKIILAGSGLYHDVLRGYDEDFADLFKVTAFFDYEMDYNKEHIDAFVRFAKKYIKEKGLLDFEAGAIAGLIEFSARVAESQKKLTARFDKICEVLTEAHIWAKAEGADFVLAAHIQKAVRQREYRYGLYEEKMSEMIEDGIVMIDTDGHKIGQINGLAAIDTGDILFAKPSRITATTYMGKAGIVNIENEAQMSGEIHDKGVQIIIGYLGQKYAQNFPLSLSCRVCFEQNYNGIDGDSASSTELYCILSSLARIPMRQDIAVTGSINQRGEIQAVGAVTAKIEGFFDLCKKRGLTGSQGVIIPEPNRLDLVLKDDVIEAVRAERFHIYVITHIDEGIELLMVKPAGETNDDGEYPENTVHGMVYARLRDFHDNGLDDDDE